MEAQRSTTGMEFVKDKVLKENAEELSSMYIDVYAHIEKDLPWELVEFSADRLVRGSTILEFSLTFKNPSRSPWCICVYRVIELPI